MDPRRKNVFIAACCSVVSLLALCGIADSVHDVWRAKQSETWPVVDGVVVESKFAQGCGRRGIHYFSTVRYEYRVGSVLHASRRITFGSAACLGENDAKDIAARYPLGAVVKVSYDPDAPGKAVLVAGQVPESTGAAIVFLTFLFLLSMALASMFVAMARSALRAQQAAAKAAPLNST